MKVVLGTFSAGGLATGGYFLSNNTFNNESQSIKNEDIVLEWVSITKNKQNNKFEKNCWRVLKTEKEEDPKYLNGCKDLTNSLEIGSEQEEKDIFFGGPEEVNYKLKSSSWEQEKGVKVDNDENKWNTGERICTRKEKNNKLEVTCIKNK